MNKIAEVAASIKGRLDKRDSNPRVSRYRQAMLDMGMKQTNHLVPEDRIKEIQLFADKLRAEHFVALLTEEVTLPARIVLSNRNSAKLPTYAEIGTLYEQVPEGNPLRGDLKALKNSVNSAMRAIAALQALNKEGGDDHEYIKWSSIQVAHSHMAKYHLDYVQWCLHGTTE